MLRDRVFEEAVEGAGGGGAAESSAVDKELEAIKKKLDEQSGTIDRLKTESNNRPVQQPQPSGPAPAGKAELEKQFWNDPLTMTAAIAQQAAREAAGQAGSMHMDTIVAVAKEQARKADSELFDKFEAEIEAEVATLPPQFKTNSTVWTNAFNIVKGRNLQQIMRDKAPQPGVGVKVNDGPSGVSPKSPSANQKKPELSDREKEIARKLRISEDEYVAGREAYNSQGSGKPGDPSSWDKVITIDSVETIKSRKRDKRNAA